MKRLPPDQQNSRIHREFDFRTYSRLAMLLFFALVLTGGFLFAAWQHFAAIDYGYKIEALRRQQQQLAAEQKRLELARDKALSYANLEPAARGIGLQPVAPGQIVIKAETQRSEARPAVPSVPAAASRH